MVAGALTPGTFLQSREPAPHQRLQSFLPFDAGRADTVQIKGGYSSFRKLLQAR